jgi:hypothetical protein
MPKPIDPGVVEALRAAGAVLIRETNHRIYGLPNGQQLVMGKSPSDHRAAKNFISIIRRVAAMPPRRQGHGQ